MQDEDEAASIDSSHSNTAAAVARKVAEVKRRGAQPIALDANAQMQREGRLRKGAGWDEAAWFAAMMTRIRAEGGVTDHVAMGLSQRHSDVVPVPAA